MNGEDLRVARLARLSGRDRRDEEGEGRAREKKSPQKAALHRCKDSINGCSTLAPTRVVARPWHLHAPSSSSSSARCSPTVRRPRRRLRERDRRSSSRAGSERSLAATWRRTPFTLAGVALARAWPRPLPHALGRGPLERMARAAPGGRGPPRHRLPRAASAERLADREPVVGRPVRPHRDANGRPRVTGSCPPRVEPRAARSRSACRLRPRRRRSCRGSRGARTSRSAATEPSYADAVRFAVVHHTAGRNAYSRAEAAAIVKGIQLYHVKSNGWNDIGYNFLVDRFGTVYEGRFGGTERNVVGAHAQGFNTGSVGIAVLGTYGGAAPSQAAQEAVADLIAWRLDLAHVDPAGLLTFISGGSNRFPSGVPVLLRAVSGHRDTGFTSCPGDAFYARLNALAAAGGADGAAEDLRAARRDRRGALPLPRAAVVGAAVGRGRSRRRPASRSRAAPAPARPSTGPGTPPCSARRATAGRSPPARARPATGPAAGSAAAGERRAHRRGEGGPGGAHAERRRPGRLDRRQLPAERGRERDRCGRGSRRRDGRDSGRPRLDARRRAHG